MSTEMEKKAYDLIRNNKAELNTLLNDPNLLAFVIKEGMKYIKLRADLLKSSMGSQLHSVTDLNQDKDEEKSKEKIPSGKIGTSNSLHILIDTKKAKHKHKKRKTTTSTAVLLDEYSKTMPILICPICDNPGIPKIRYPGGKDKNKPTQVIYHPNGKDHFVREQLKYMGAANDFDGFLAGKYMIRAPEQSGAPSKSKTQKNITSRRFHALPVKAKTKCPVCKKPGMKIIKTVRDISTGMIKTYEACYSYGFDKNGRRQKQRVCLVNLIDTQAMYNAPSHVKIEEHADVMTIGEVLAQEAPILGISSLLIDDRRENIVHKQIRE